MIIHSVAPLDALLPRRELPETTTLPCRGGYVEGILSAQGLTISRLISTDPALYLDARLQPGEIYPIGPTSPGSSQP